jgi:propionate CoA-transferase
LYITERAVFRLDEKGLTLIEVAPGINIEKDILANMDFRPFIPDTFKLMDQRIFYEDKMGINSDRSQ